MAARQGLEGALMLGDGQKASIASVEEDWLIISHAPSVVESMSCTQRGVATEIYLNCWCHPAQRIVYRSIPISDHSCACKLQFFRFEIQNAICGTEKNSSVRRRNAVSERFISAAKLCSQPSVGQSLPRRRHTAAGLPPKACVVKASTCTRSTALLFSMVVWNFLEFGVIRKN